MPVAKTAGAGSCLSFARMLSVPASIHHPLFSNSISGTVSHDDGLSRPRLLGSTIDSCSYLIDEVEALNRSVCARGCICSCADGGGCTVCCASCCRGCCMASQSTVTCPECQAALAREKVLRKDVRPPSPRFSTKQELTDQKTTQVQAAETFTRIVPSQVCVRVFFWLVK